MTENTVFTLTSGRSGTLFLCGLLRKNAPDCMVMHEPYLHPGNPSLFGLPIYDHWAGNLGLISKLVAQKREAIERYRAASYIETSHAFLKSYWDIAPGFFPHMKVLHLIRHPLEVARSEANREAFINRWRLPWRDYRGRDGQRYFRWALTGREAIYDAFDLGRITLFQRYLLQWIEIENRAMEFLSRFDMDSSCMTLHTPQDLMEPRSIHELFRFLNLNVTANEVSLPHFQNRTPGSFTVIGDEETIQCREIIEKIPARYLDIFRHVPYAECQWRGLLQK